MELQIITPTGERPEAFNLCQKMMQRQTYAGSVHWVVVDDGNEPQTIWLEKDRWRITVLRPEPFWEIGQNTQGRNLNAGLKTIESGQPLTIIEDDDYVAPGWLQFIADNIGKAELIGEHGAVYYNVRKRTWRGINNLSHGCLRCSAMRGDAINRFREVLKTPDKYYDLKLWRAHGDKATFPRKYTLGLKGLPGRQGIAQGHDGLTGDHDPKLKKLYELIGDDAKCYAEFYEENGMYTDQLYCAKPITRSGRRYKAGEAFTERLSPNEKMIFVASGMLVRKTVRAKSLEGV